MEIGTSTRPRRPSSTGTTRRSSSSAGSGAAPGRVDSPPMSRRSAPSRDHLRAHRAIGDVGIEPLAAVGERVGRDVEDAHDERARARVRATRPSGSGTVKMRRGDTGQSKSANSDVGRCVKRELKV